MVPFDFIETINDPNMSLELFYSIINNVLSNHAPLKTKRVKRDNQPTWLNEEIKRAIFQRDKLHKNKEF